MIPVLPISYFGPVDYFLVLAQHEEVQLENWEHFVKQSCRNRCAIYGANGRLVLSIPLNRKRREKTGIQEVQINYDADWQSLHWKSIASAYRSSPFFEYYEDQFAPLFLQKWDTLYALNQEILNLLIKLIGLSTKISTTGKFEKNYSLDYRYVFKGGLSSVVNTTRYIQVFEEKCGFLPNLSILDLLFNQGPQTLTYLKQQQIIK